MFVLPNVLSPPAAVALSERYCYAACPLAMLLHCRRRRPASPSSRSITMGLLKLFVAEEPLAVNMGFHAKRRMATKHLPAANKFNGTSLLLLLVFVTIYFTGSLNSSSPTIFLCPASHISPMHAAAVVVAIYVCA